MNYKDFLLYKWYLFIPILITITFSINSAIINYFPTGWDFNAFYFAGENIFTNPELVYSTKSLPTFIYMPGAAVFFSFFTILTFEKAIFVYFLILLVLAIFSLILLDKILTLRDTELYMRFLILTAVSGGYVLILMFDLLQSKHIILFLLLLLLKREIEWGNKKFNYLFFSTQALLLVIAVSFLPYLIFPSIIYMFHKTNGIFSLIQIKKYFTFFLEFFLFNFMFLIDPSLISGFLRGFEQVNRSHILFRRGFPTMILFNVDKFFPLPWTSLSGIITLITLPIITFYLSLKKYKIEIKFGLFFLFFLIFSSTYYACGHFAVILPIVILLFKEKNEYSLLSIFLIFGLYFLPPLHISFNIEFLLQPFLVLLVHLNPLYIYLLLCFKIQGKLKRKNNKLYQFEDNSFSIPFYNEVNDRFSIQINTIFLILFPTTLFLISYFIIILFFVPFYPIIFFIEIILMVFFQSITIYLIYTYKPNSKNVLIISVICYISCFFIILILFNQ